MTRRGGTDHPPPTDLLGRMQDPGFTPSIKLLPQLIHLLSEHDEAVHKRVERAILKIEAQYAPRVTSDCLAAIEEAERPLRGRLAHLLGRLAQERRDPDRIVPWLIQALDDSDPKTRRAAARGLGKLGPAQVPAELAERIASALADAFDRASSDDDRRVLAVALGKTGSEEASARLAGVDLGRASIIAERELVRKSPGEIDRAGRLGDHANVRGVRLMFHTRSGLEDVLKEELVATSLGTARFAAPGVVEADLAPDAPLSDALSVRTATHVGLPIEPSERSSGDLASDIVEVLARDETLARLRAYTHTGSGGAIRFRLAFASGGHRRSVVWRVAELVRERMPELVNDPKESTWEVVVHERAGSQPMLELVPRGFQDERFQYRGDVVPASSHPVIAAALARVAPRTDEDVVWDPFTGAGAELIERARLGPYRQLIGTDIDARAIAAARANAARAGLLHATFLEADACTFKPPGDTPINLVITNPPMGRRVERGGHADLLDRFLTHASAILAPDGAIVWLAPQPERARARAALCGLELDRAFSVDMGGFPAELSVYRKPKH